MKQEKEALEYGKKLFLVTKAKIDYLLIKDNIGFTLWIEEPSAKLLNNQSSTIDIVNTIELEKLVTKMRNIGGIKI